MFAAVLAAVPSTCTLAPCHGTAYKAAQFVTQLHPAPDGGT
jgi:hypothetical protein